MVNVMIVEDNHLLRQHVRREIEEHKELSVVGEAEDGLTAVNLALEIRPDVVVMDVGLARLDGVEATRRLKIVAPDISVVGLSLYDDELTRKTMLNAGASAFVCKNVLREQLIKAIMNSAAPGAGDQPDRL
jgi:DNA-binding NarL/FixJ family response regulator